MSIMITDVNIFNVTFPQYHIGSGASKGIPGNAKCVTEILGGTKIRKFGAIQFFLGIPHSTSISVE